MGRCVPMKWTPLVVLLCAVLQLSRAPAAAFCLPGIVRVTLMPLVAEGGSCEGGNEPDGPPLCRMLPDDLFACCGVGSSITDCLSSDCCPDSSPPGEVPSDLVVDEVVGGDPSEAGGPEVAECRVSETQDCGLDFLRANIGGRHSWMVYPRDEQPCLDGSEYSFQVFPGEANGRLLLWFQGGGACNSYEACFQPDLSTATSSVQPNSAGLFDVRRGGENPAVAGGWTMVVVNYCSGDVHVGNNVHNFSAPTGQTQAAVYAGANHTRAVLDWIADQEFGDEEFSRRVAGGCSAGSLGVQLWAPALLADYGFSDGILMDGYAGIMPSAAQSFWQLINLCEVGENELMWTTEAVQACREGFYVPTFTAEMLKDNSDVPAMYVGTNNDIIQRGFYIASAGNIRNTDKAVFVDAAEYINVNLPSLLADLMSNYSDASPAFQSALIQSDQHCLVSTSELYGAAGQTNSLLERVTDFLSADSNQPSPPPSVVPNPAIDNDDSHAEAINPLTSLCTFAVAILFLLASVM